MIIRLVVGVAVAVALLSLSLPVVENARVAGSDSTVRDALDRLTAVTSTMAARNDPVPRGAPGAREPLRLRLPGAGPGRARIVRLRFAAGGPAASVARWRVAGADGVRQRVLPDIVTPEPLTLDGGGTHRLILTYEQRSRGPVVTIRRARPYK
jgi:hypothetical protein